MSNKSRNERIHGNTNWLDKVWDTEIDAAIERIGPYGGSTQRINTNDVRAAVIESLISSELK